IDWSKVISPQAFKQRCEAIVQQHSGHQAHRMLDQLVTETLCSLGYSEGMATFVTATRGWHRQVLRYPLPLRPRWACRIGLHRWSDDVDTDFPWVATEVCRNCGKTRSLNPCP